MGWLLGGDGASASRKEGEDVDRDESFLEEFKISKEGVEGGYWPSA